MNDGALSPLVVQALMQALDAVEVQCFGRAFGGCVLAMHHLQTVMTAAFGPVSTPSTAPAQLTWRLFKQLRLAVDARSTEAMSSALSDLRQEVCALALTGEGAPASAPAP